MANRIFNPAPPEPEAERRYSVKLNNGAILFDNLTARQFMALNSRFFSMLLECGHLDNLLDACLSNAIPAFRSFLGERLGRSIDTAEDLEAAIHTVDDNSSNQREDGAFLGETLDIAAFEADFESVLREMESSRRQSNNPR